MIRVTFHRPSSPYQPGDIAGFPDLQAGRLVARGLAVYTDRKPEPPVDFGAMTREQLLEHAARVLGLTEAPPADVTDDELREVLEQHAKGMPVPPAADAEPTESTLDQLDVLDRAHLEAFATTKAGFAEVDPALTDIELREQIRAKIEATVSTTAAVKKVGKAAR